MDRLPVEILREIAVLLGSPVSEKSGALAALARTNKMLNEIATRLLYEHPVVTGPENCQLWIEFYTSKINPWTLAKGRKGLESTPVPRSVTFGADGTAKAPFDEKWGSYRAPESRIDVSLPCPTPHFPWFFRNLTSFTVEKFASVDNDLVANLFGRGSPCRTTIVHLSLEGAIEWNVVLFLLEAWDQFTFEWHYRPESCFAGLDRAYARDLDAREVRDEDIADAEWDAIDDFVTRITRIRYSVFNTNYLDEDGHPDGYLPDYLWHQRDARIHQRLLPPAVPFSNLVTLSLPLHSNAEIYLLFCTQGLFPALKTLKLSGTLSLYEGEGDDSLLFRHSITK
ncbi:hypothetical protein JCM11491_003184 [Sporobolomyces phaffii]